MVLMQQMKQAGHQLPDKLRTGPHARALHENVFEINQSIKTVLCDADTRMSHAT